MKLFEGCLLACDIDGTLLTNGVIPQKNIEAIDFFVENGGIFALATGRSVGAVKSVTDKIKCIGPSVVSNGGMIYDYQSEKIIFESQIEKSDYEIMYKMKELFPDIGIEIHFNKKVGVFNKTNETDDHERYEDLPSDIYDKEQIKDLSLNKILYALNGKEEIQKVHKIVDSIKCNCTFVDTGATLYERKRYYLEQFPKGISKFSGIKRLSEHLNVKKGDLFAIGDYNNDFDMLKFADIAAAPENALREIKEIADYITTDVENGAVADFIGYLTKLRRS